jgi:hypothetical protein
MFAHLFCCNRLVKAFEKTRFRPTYPDFLHGAPPTAACAAFIKESRTQFANASKVDRKSGVRFGERGTRPVPELFYENYECTNGGRQRGDAELDLR